MVSNNSNKAPHWERWRPRRHLLRVSHRTDEDDDEEDDEEDDEDEDKTASASARELQGNGEALGGMCQRKKKTRAREQAEKASKGSAGVFSE